MTKIINKLLTSSFVLLVALTVVGHALSCGHSKPHSLTYVKPYLTRADLWHDKGIVVHPNIPIRVKSTGVLATVLDAHASRSVNMWNKAVGCNVFALSADTESEVKISVEPNPPGRNWAASQKYVVRRTSMGVYYWGSDVHVYTLKVKDNAYMDNIMSHELGHVLGLKDQYDEEDHHLVMHSNSRYGKALDAAGVLYLRGLYCE